MKDKNKKILIFLICITISLLMLFFNESFIKDLNNIIYILILTIGVTLSTNSVAAFISDRFKDNELNEIAKQNFSVLKYCQDYGLIGIYKGFPLEDEYIKNDILNSKNLYIIMNDAKRFISDNTLLIEQRLKKKNLFTAFVLQDLNQADVMDALTSIS